MSFVGRVPLRVVKGLSEREKKAIKRALMKAVNVSLRAHPEGRFAMRDVVNLKDADSPGNPLLPLLQKHVQAGKSRELALAATNRDLGWLLREALGEDERVFDARPTTRRQAIFNYGLAEEGK